MKSEKKRHLLIGGVGMVRGKVKHSGSAMLNLCDDLEPKIVGTAFLKNAPFETVSLVIRFGEIRGLPEIGRINRVHSELYVAIETPMSEVRSMELGDLTDRFRQLTLSCLMHVAIVYGLDIPTWLSES